MKKDQQTKNNWKQNLVLIAKNTFVWMFQLSEKYNKPIKHLDQIPIEELESLRSYGLNGLWLIGIWERSPASKKIKELYGKKNAIASAYSIFNYRITNDLGGEEAYLKLKIKANNAGLKLGCDMVPNHTGIDSPWVVEHPDWFIQSKLNPSSVFKYNSPNLSLDPRAKIQIEEGYYTQTGAAEVFQFSNNSSSEKNLYIYHGNDGTSMPWNDTAQLNYLNEETRAAVRKVILDVAGKFDIIRLDAAMTLTKQHYKRLWFPNTGASKFIPTRGNNNMDKSEFDHLMPREFWIDVLENIREKEPNTLLIAEAFWLMEGFFIQHLGMDRVYNSAFMNLLRDEENKKFKQCVKDMIAIDPLYLERLVNYQSTPDEEPAINQFGNKEKYFGICTLLATMPGLPMFGHGQFEGYRERYGMDFYQPHFKETPDEKLISRHKKQIQPLLESRFRYSSSKNFKLLDCYFTDGKVNNDVIAYTNQNDAYHSLVIYNNVDKRSDGFIKIHLESSENNAIILIDFYKKEEIQIPSSTIKEQKISVKLSPYECRVYEIRAGFTKENQFTNDPGDDKNGQVIV